MPQTAPFAPGITLSKADAARAIGKSERTLEQYVHDGRIAVRYENTTRGRTAIFERADVERLKAELAVPQVRAVAAPQSSVATATVQREANPPRLDTAVRGAEDFIELVRTIRDAQPPPLLPWLTLDQASEASGLPKAFLSQAAIDGSDLFDVLDVGAGRRGGRFRFRRESLT